MVGKSKNKVCYFYDSEFQTFYFGQNHPMKPHRLAMTHHLVVGYDLHKQMEVFVSAGSAAHACAHIEAGAGPAMHTHACTPGTQQKLLHAWPLHCHAHAHH